LISGLLEACDHDYSLEMGRTQSVPRPRTLRLAEDYLEAHLADQITVEDIAEAAGVSVRGLQLAFREHRGTSPMGFWRDRRLARAHQGLVAGEGSVTDMALKCGFYHFGRFAAAYRMKYGRSPSDTLRGARGPNYQD
jgi:transcriptional regulator GlxA family with amidase domain